MKQKLVFSVDVEDGIFLSMRDEYGKTIPQTERVLKNTHQILDVLQKHGQKGTFFALGMVAEAYPDLVKRIAHEGHELAVHGYQHFVLTKMSPQEAKEELGRAKDILEQLTGNQVVGHRAPAFSLVPKTDWLFDVLGELGYTYDSSVLPSNLGAYHWQEFGEQFKMVEGQYGSVAEFPLPVVKVGKWKIPFSGGGYMRVLPAYLYHHVMRRYGQNGQVPIHYMHPYELDTSPYPQWYIDEFSAKGTLKKIKVFANKWNRASVHAKIERLASNYQCLTLRELLEERQQQHTA